jgi:hypothetical protein
MRIVRGRGIFQGLAAVLLVLGLGQTPSNAQFGFVPGIGAGGEVFAPSAGGRPPLAGRAPIIDQGWAEVLTVTSKWVVIQNADGQQFPIAFDSIDLFIARSPVQISSIPQDSLVEATGLDAGEGAVRTEHVDVYVGGARSMVTPTFLYLNGRGQLLRQIDFTYNPGVYGDIFGVEAPIQGNVLAGAVQIHIVGPPISRIPLRLNTPGNSGIGIFPSTPAGLSATAITPGTSSILKPGDPVYYVATGLGVKSVKLSQLIVYKDSPPS